MKIRSVNLWTIAMAVLMAVTLPSLAMSQEIKVGAGAAGTEDIFNKIKVPFEKTSGTKLVLISNGPVEALKELDKGLLEVAVGGVTFLDWMEMMEKEGYKVPDKNVYKYQVIGKDTVKIIVAIRAKLVHFAELRLKTANFKVDFSEDRGYLNQAEKQNRI